MARTKAIACAVLIVAVLLGRWRLSQDVVGEVLEVPTGSDPELREDIVTLDKAISRPALVSEAKEIVLLVHGTGMTFQLTVSDRPQINWDSTFLQPLIHENFQPYYLEVPKRLFLDVQTSAEYISHAIKKLAREQELAEDGLSVISWSAGSLAVQWTLTFYPETRSKVKRHIALGPSYRGSWMMLPLYYFNLYSEAVVQQLPWSNLLAALRRHGGGKAHVPTTNIGSATDMIVQPGFYGEKQGSFENRDSWRLDGPLARNIDLFRLCASKLLWRDRWLPRLISHDSLLWEWASHMIVFDALRNEETYLGSADGVMAIHCLGLPAPYMEADADEKHAAILPELFEYAPKQPRTGWPEVPLRDYAI